MDETTNNDLLDISKLPDVVPANQQYQNVSNELTANNLNGNVNPLATAHITGNITDNYPNGTVNPSSEELKVTGDVTYNNSLPE